MLFRPYYITTIQVFHGEKIAMFCIWHLVWLPCPSLYGPLKTPRLFFKIPADLYVFQYHLFDWFKIVFFFTVPLSWPIIDWDKYPSSAVRMRDLILFLKQWSCDVWFMYVYYQLYSTDFLICIKELAE